MPLDCPPGTFNNSPGTVFPRCTRPPLTMVFYDFHYTKLTTIPSGGGHAVVVSVVEGGLRGGKMCRASLPIDCLFVSRSLVVRLLLLTLPVLLLLLLRRHGQMSRLHCRLYLRERAEGRMPPGRVLPLWASRKDSLCPGDHRRLYRPQHPTGMCGVPCGEGLHWR